MQLFWGQQELRKAFSLGENRVVATMTVIGVDFEKIQLQVAFWAEEKFLETIVGFGNLIFTEFQSDTDQRISYIEEITLREPVPRPFFYLYCLFESEIVVVGVDVESLVLYTKLLL